jgi:DNA modification methylase
VIHHGDCLDVLRTLPENSVDACVTDPPYGLSFMGKRWDYDVPAVEVWAEVLRVLKPGGHLLCFAGTRTQHRMAVRIEDAGFEIRDMIAWVYGSGFPKSHNGPWGGTALKPALEPITVARKPLIGTVAANVQQFGTGGINVDGCRVGMSATDAAFILKTARPNSAGCEHVGSVMNRPNTPTVNVHAAGRWPANLIHDGSEDVVALFPREAGSNSTAPGTKGEGMFGARVGGPTHDASRGSAARFFYCAKASKHDRDEGLAGFTPKQRDDSRKEGNPGGDNPRNRGVKVRANNHPTVKPTDLMRYLVRLVTPAGGTVLDPFTGSGSTGKACKLEGFDFIGIEREADYVAIAEARIAAVEREQPSVDTEPALPFEASA